MPCQICDIGRTEDKLLNLLLFPTPDSHPECEFHEGVRGKDDGGECQGLTCLFQDRVEAPVWAQVEVH